MEFGPFRLDPSAKSLYLNGEFVPLTPKLAALLCVLVEEPGRLVTKDEILQRVWKILKRAETLGSSDFMFPGRAADAGLSNMTLSMALQRLRRNDGTPHGFRSSLRDWAGERTNFAHAVVEAALAHVVRNKIEAANFRSDLFDLRRKLMEAWSLFVNAIPGKVVRLRA